MLLEMRGSRWALSKEERELIGPPTAAVLAKYCGNVALGLEMTCLTAWAMYAIPRLIAGAAEVEAVAIAPSDQSIELDRRHLEQPAKLRGVKSPKASRARTLSEIEAEGGPI